jgi:hypothetical protein
VPPVHNWVEVPNLPHEGGPNLLRLSKAKPRREPVPAPPRPLGAAGLDTWRRLWATAVDGIDEVRALMLAEQADERVALRLRVLREAQPEDRHGLRQLDGQLLSGLAGWHERHADRRLTAWPEPTKAWWRAVASMPHASTWQPSEWQHAMDTALLHAAVANGDLRWAGELRVRERMMGTTADARRDLRIRYVEPETGEPTEDQSVVAMDAYRRAVGFTHDDD